MMRLCGRQSAACIGNVWPCALVPRRLSSGQKVNTTCQDKRSSRCVLVVSEAKKLSSLAENGTARQVCLWELWLPRHMLTTREPAAKFCPDLLQQQRWSSSKRRLDEACLEQKPLIARNVMHSWIVQGKVQVNGKVVSKPGTPVSAKAKIDILAAVQQYVCRYVISRFAWTVSSLLYSAIQCPVKDAAE